MIAASLATLVLAHLVTSLIRQDWTLSSMGPIGNSEGNGGEHSPVRPKLDDPPKQDSPSPSPGSPLWEPPPSPEPPDEPPDEPPGDRPDDQPQQPPHSPPDPELAAQLLDADLSPSSHGSGPARPNPRIVIPDPPLWKKLTPRPLVVASFVLLLASLILRFILYLRRRRVRIR